MIQRYKARPDEFVKDAKRQNFKRMEKQSAYIRTQGYKCAAIVEQLKATSRKKAYPDQFDQSVPIKVHDAQEAES